VATEPIDPERYRRRQRRRALVGWSVGLLSVALIVVAVGLSADETRHHRAFEVPYGEVMTSRDYAEISTGEEDAVVLERLDESGRPERLTEPYVLALFPPREEGVYCTYWEFSDKPRIFARLCFSTSNGELVQKRKHDVLHPPIVEPGRMI
jgi:hypothetical protein